MITKIVRLRLLIRSYKPITEELGENVLPQVMFAFKSLKDLWGFEKMFALFLKKKISK